MSRPASLTCSPACLVFPSAWSARPSASMSSSPVAWPSFSLAVPVASSVLFFALSARLMCPPSWVRPPVVAAWVRDRSGAGQAAESLAAEQLGRVDAEPFEQPRVLVGVDLIGQLAVG